jgi:hypothetical protein
MGLDLRMEPYAEMFEKERPESRIVDELCFRDISDKLCDRLGLSWEDLHAAIDEEGRLPHAAALRLLAAVESHHALAEKAAYLASLLPRLVRASRTCRHPDAGSLKRPRAWHGGPNRPSPRQASLLGVEDSTSAPPNLARKRL